MKNASQVTENILIAGQPKDTELQELQAQGYKTVINLRSDDESGVISHEERIVAEAGLNYASIPVSPNSINETKVGRFLQTLSTKDALPAVVHCGGGGRAGIMVLLHLAITQKWSVQQALAQGEEMGIAPAPGSPYRKYFEDYVKQHSAGERR
jgi:uncharacterized protein (TIGR01244 family)